MSDRSIAYADSAELLHDRQLTPVRSMLAMLNDFAGARSHDIAPQDENPAIVRYSLATRYAAANSITRRRFDAILREAELIGGVGLALMAGRRDRSDPGSITAARFLGKSIDALLCRLDKLLTPQAA